MSTLTHSSNAPNKVSPWRKFVLGNRASLGTLAVFVVMMLIFFAFAPGIFSRWPIYNSVLLTLPVALFLVVPLVFVVTVSFFVLGRLGSAKSLFKISR